jgi:hypothetical protein
LEDFAVAIEDIIKTVQKLSSDQIQELIDKNEAEGKTLRTLWRAAIVRERHERKLQRERREEVVAP